MDPRDHYRKLHTYLGAYLHEDWMYEFASPDEAYEAVLKVFWPESVARLVEELNELLALPDKEMLSTLAVLSRNLNPRTDYGWDEREWLSSLRDRAKEELKRRRASADGGSTP